MGWEARIGQRDDALAHAAGAVGSAHPVAHLASFDLPDERGDYGSGAVDVMRPLDALIVLVEHDPTSIGTALFARVGMPRRLTATQFSPAALQRTIPGQGGFQCFFTEAGRAFSLYVVLGSHALAHRMVGVVNDVLSTVRLDR